MRTLLAALCIAAFVPTAHAAVIIYDIDADFGLVSSPGSGLPRVTPGGTVMGFIQFDTSKTDNAAILDYELMSTLPSTFDNPFLEVDYRFSDIGNSDAGEDRDGFSFVSSTGALSFTSDILSVASGRVVAASTSILSLNLGTLGADMVPVTGGERFINCSSGFNFFGFFNVCDRPLANNANLSTSLSIRDTGGTGTGGTGGSGTGGTGGSGSDSGMVAIPTPASLPLLLVGLCSLGFLPRRFV